MTSSNDITTANLSLSLNFSVEYFVRETHILRTKREYVIYDIRRLFQA